jgi:hypothetical protein
MSGGFPQLPSCATFFLALEQLCDFEPKLPRCEIPLLSGIHVKSFRMNTPEGNKYLAWHKNQGRGTVIVNQESDEDTYPEA